MCLSTIPRFSFSKCHSITIDRGISAPGYEKEVIDGLNVMDKRYMYKLISTVQLTVSKIFKIYILMHSCTPKNDVSLAKEFQKHLSKEHRKHGFIDQGKSKKIFSKIKFTDREYRVKDNSDAAHKYVKMYCDTNQFPTSPFCGSHTKPNGAGGLVKNYHLRFDPKLGHGICAIRRIKCACVTCTLVLGKNLIAGIPSTK